ncbi:MAG TPA: flagellar basal-body MS-ring/collar protein FliF [Gaiellales bacterium]|nr:flagellar basal-body MS-ring/collar protein FliF [Gaiellales bacterium]
MPNLTSLRDFWRSLEPRAQMTLVASVLAVVVVMYGIYHFASQPSYSTIQTGLDPTSTGRITSALAAAGVTYKLENGGTAIAVQSGQESQAQVALGSAGLASGGHVDFSLFDHSSLSATDFQQQVNYQRALEGQIANTIEGIAGVDSAQVQLVLPKDQLFQDQASQATASVMVDAPLGLTPSSVQGIAHMTASSVQGLDPQNVTITDQTGAMLWPTGDGSGLGGAPSKLAAQDAYASQLSARIDALLANILGPGKAEARVNADLNVDKTTTDSVTYDHTHPPVVLNRNSTEETLKSAGGALGGIAGTGGNLNGGTSFPGGSGKANSNYVNKTEQVQNGVDKTVAHTEVAPGSINRLNVALLVDKSVSAADVTAVQNAVSSMVGLDPSRGDTITTSTLAFAKPATAGASGGGLAGLGSPIDMAKTGGAAIAAIIFLFLVRRNLKRREGDPVAPEPRWLKEITQSTPIAQLGSGPTQATAVMPERRQHMQATAEEIVKNQPDAVAMQVAQWMNE